MSFLSFNFAIFLGLALLIFYFTPARWKPVLLLVLSYVFYFTWSIVDTLLLAAVTVGVYATARWIAARKTERGKHALMAVSVMTLLVLLFGFKAAGLIVKEFFAHDRGSGPNGAVLVLVPLGLSYYIFKTVGYLLDVYWEMIPVQRNFVSLALYVSFFPQIVSGPIQRAQNFLNQVDKIKHPDAGEFVVGLRRILFGLFKKIVIADRLAVLVANVHGNPAGYSSLELLVGAYCYSIQLYTDFSGITDIAIGIGQLFGVKGPENFNLPYYAINIQEFWRRWHMSLTTWLTDYLFMPLRMSLRSLGTSGLCLAIFINMVAIGLWHGLAATFLAFGIINGIFMTVSVLTLKQRNRFFQKRPGLVRLRELGGPLLTFHLVVFTHIFFRANNLTSAFNYIAGLIPGLQRNAVPALRFDLSWLGISAATLMFCAISALATDGVTWAARRRFWIDWFFATPVFFRRVVYCALIGAVLFLYKGTVTFIYAQF
jgi:hypothetical protein